MGLTTIPFSEGSSLSQTGGTAVALGSLGDNTNPITLYATADSDVRSRREFVFGTRSARANSSAPNGYTQQRSFITVKVPLALDNGEVTVNTIRVELSCDVETNDAEKLALREYGIQAILATQAQEFWDSQSISS